MSRLHPSSEGSGSIGAGIGGEKAEAAKIRAAISSIDPAKDMSNFASIPCARKSVLMGMTTAAGVSGISFVAGRGLKRGLNWGVGSFCFVSLATFEMCRRNRKAEQMRMKTIIDGYKDRSSRANRPSLSTLAEKEATSSNTSSTATTTSPSST